MTPSFKERFLRRQIAVPGDHGSWVFLLSPLLIGLFAGGKFELPQLYLVIAALSAFLIRQPVTIAIKAYSGRRPRRDLPAARFWMVVYALIGLLHVTGLVLRGYGYVLLLAIPGIPVFAWHLYLVSRRAERRAAGVEIVASGVLALAAPAATWIGAGWPDPRGWLLFGLVWLQSAASIVYAYLRLSQRKLPARPTLRGRLQMGQRALLYTTFNLVLATTLALVRIVPAGIVLAFAVQWLETIWGALQPAVKAKPTTIGVRQLIVSTLFTIIFILGWRW